MKGVNGKILWVDLTTKNLVDEKVEDQVYKDWLGGYGLGVYQLYKAIKPGSDPLGAGNVLGFVPGMFTGSAAPITGRCFIVGKSPKTGGWNDSSVGGFLGMAIKKAGYDAIFVKGASKDPVYVYIGDGKTEIIDAGDLWGLDTEETDKALKAKHGNSARTCSIGKAGELLSPLAGIVCDGGRIAARGGMGAVAGSKKLKALCLSGAARIEYADSKAIVELTKAYNQKVNKNEKDFIAKMATAVGPKAGPLLRATKMDMLQPHAISCRVFKNWGTAYALPIQVAVGDTPIKNFKGHYQDFPFQIGQQFTTEGLEKWITGHQGCFSCPIQCGHVLKIPELGMERTHRPEYETLASFGPLLLNPDVKVVVQANDMLNRAGMDSISAGVVCAFVAECCEKGILGKKDFECKEYPDGFTPAWREPNWILPLLRMIVNREGIGDLLARGVSEAARVINKGAEDYAMAINGQEIPMHDPRKFFGLAMTYIADPTPARHTAASLDFSSMGQVNDFVDGISFDLSKKGRVKGDQHARFAMFVQVCNAVGLCYFALNFERYPLFEMFKAVAGLDLSPADLFTIGQRIQVMRHMFNAREAAIRYNVPKRALGIPPLEKGPLAGVTLAPRKGIELYQSTMGLDERGIPTREVLERLGLGFAVPDLAKVAGMELASLP
ncbi:MAG: aldehyde ferredoxin oxidoreductase family protein [Candidatus Sigynarchaeota archaeon]